MASLRLEGAWTLALLLVALLAVSTIPSSLAQTASTTAVTGASNTTAGGNTTVKSPAPSPAKAPVKAPAPAPKKAPPPPPPYYPPSQHRKNAVYGLTFGGIGFCLSVLLGVLIHDFVRKVGYFQPKDRSVTQNLLDKGEFKLPENTNEEIGGAAEGNPRAIKRN